MMGEASSTSPPKDDVFEDVGEEESEAFLGNNMKRESQPSNTSRFWHRSKVARVFAAALALAAVVTVISVFHGTTAFSARRSKPKDKDAVVLKELQVQNYIEGRALMLNVHVTHHAGTVFCAKIGHVGPTYKTPDFACMGGDNWPSNIPHSKSWSYNDTATMVDSLRPFFHMISWEYRYFGNLHQTNWEYENLVSVIVMRHPIDRFLAGGKCGRRGEHREPSTPQEWWEYAESKCADNYALRVLAPNKDCCNGANTSLEDLEGAKNLLRRFTFVMDQECLDDSLLVFAKIMDLPLEASSLKTGLHKIHPPAQERIANDTLYHFLENKFRRDIELYEWSKTISLVNCSAAALLNHTVGG